MPGVSPSLRELVLDHLHLRSEMRYLHCAGCCEFMGEIVMKLRESKLYAKATDVSALQQPRPLQKIAAFPGRESALHPS